MIGYRQGLFTHEHLAHAFAMATDLPAKVLELDSYGVAVGRFADLVLILSGSIAEAVLDRPQGRSVIKRGRLVSGPAGASAD